MTFDELKQTELASIDKSSEHYTVYKLDPQSKNWIPVEYPLTIEQAKSIVNKMVIDLKIPAASVYIELTIMIKTIVPYSPSSA